MIKLRGEASENAAYVHFTADADINLAELQGDADVSHVSLNKDMKETVETSFAA